MLACTFVHAKFDHRAPEGKAMLRCFLGGARDPEVLGLNDEEVVAIVRRELKEILNFTAEPLFFRVHRWPASMAQYPVGHRERVSAIEERLGGPARTVSWRGTLTRASASRTASAPGGTRRKRHWSTWQPAVGGRRKAPGSGQSTAGWAVYEGPGFLRTTTPENLREARRFRATSVLSVLEKARHRQNPPRKLDSGRHRYVIRNAKTGQGNSGRSHSPHGSGLSFNFHFCFCLWIVRPTYRLA